MVDTDVGGDAMFNQAAFQQARLHELFSKLDNLSIDIFLIDMETGKYRFESVFNYLNSIVSTVSPKLTETELKLLKQYRKLIRDIIEVKSIFKDSKQISFNGTGGGKVPDSDYRNKLSDLLFDYRIQIEIYMDAHGLSNPNKEAEAGWD